MTAVATQSAPVYVQQSFLWDDVETGAAQTPSRQSSAPSNQSKSKTRQNRPPMTVPTVSTSSSARRGRCEHVGGILASVLEKYGIGIDQLIAEIDGLQ